MSKFVVTIISSASYETRPRVLNWIKIDHGLDHYVACFADAGCDDSKHSVTVETVEKSVLVRWRCCLYFHNSDAILALVVLSVEFPSRSFLFRLCLVLLLALLNVPSHAFGMSHYIPLKKFITAFNLFFQFLIFIYKLLHFVVRTYFGLWLVFSRSLQFLL